MGRLYRGNNGENRFRIYEKINIIWSRLFLVIQKIIVVEKMGFEVHEQKDEDKRHAVGHPVCGVPVLSPY